MNKEIATKVFESLASGVRLDVYRLLVKAGLEGMVAGQIASTLAIAPNNLSFHLKALTHAGLVTAEQEGRFQRYRANLPLMLELIAYLTEQCCEGHPEQCASLRADAGCAPALLPPLSGRTAAGCCAETTQVAGCNSAGEYRALGADVTDKREKMNKPYHELIPGRIYFGGAADIQQMVDEEGVEVVVDLREESSGCAASAENVRWLQVSLADHATTPEPALFASAIAAVSPVVKARNEAIAYAVSTIFLFNVLAVLIFPWLGHALGLTQHEFGLFAGTAVNDTSSVVATAGIYGSAALSFAVVVKLVRTLMIIPISLGLAALEARKEAAGSLGSGSQKAGADSPTNSAAPRISLLGALKLIPWFLIGFLLASVLRSVGLVPDAAQAPLAQIAMFFISIAMAAIGLSTDVAGFRKAGLRPLMLGGLLWIIVTATAIGAIFLMR